MTWRLCEYPVTITAGAEASGPGGGDGGPEWLLPGGFVNQGFRIADTVRRPAPEATEFVRGLLRHLEGCGWFGAPRDLRVDGPGRERGATELATRVCGNS